MPTTNTKFSWVPAKTNTDGSSLTAAQVAALAFTVYVDTVSPPLKPFPVPAAKITPDVDASAAPGSVQVLFSDLGFVPVTNVKYYADMTEAETLPDGTVTTSIPTTVASFMNEGTPNAPQNFTVG